MKLALGASTAASAGACQKTGSTSEEIAQAVTNRLLDMRREIAATEVEIDRVHDRIDQAYRDLEAARDEESKQRAMTARREAKADLRRAQDWKNTQIEALRQYQARARQEGSPTEHEVLGHSSEALVVPLAKPEVVSESGWPTYPDEDCPGCGRG
jgi:chromosome segregation ATPase